MLRCLLDFIIEYILVCKLMVLFRFFLLFFFLSRRSCFFNNGVDRFLCLFNRNFCFFSGYFLCCSSFFCCLDLGCFCLGRFLSSFSKRFLLS